MKAYRPVEMWLQSTLISTLEVNVQGKYIIRKLAFVISRGVVSCMKLRKASCGLDVADNLLSCSRQS